MSECIVFFATAWGALYGGINSFNYDLCKALVKYLNEHDFNLRIVCIVDEGREAKEGKDAKELGVQLFINALSDDFESYIETINARLTQAKLKPTWVVGHDTKTGLRAIKLAETCSVPVAIFHHMNYEAYKSVQVGDDEKYVVLQRQILSAAKIVFAIGPKLKESACGIVGEKISVIEVLPGLADIEIWNAQSTFSAITFGRLEHENDLLKQTSLAVASFAKAVQTSGKPLGGNAGLKVIGFSDEEGEEYRSLKKIVQKYTNNYTSLHPWKYNKNRVELFDHLRRETVCMMLSIHEGFGLTGLEAISAGVPLILSKNTGLYFAVKNALKGAGTGRLYPVDVLSPDAEEEYHEKTATQVSEILLDIAKDKKEAKENAKSLKQDLAKLWTWESTAIKVIEELGFKGNTLTPENKQEMLTEIQADTDRGIHQKKIANIIEFKPKNPDNAQSKTTLLPREELEDILQDLNDLIENIEALIQVFTQGVYLSTRLEKLISELKEQRKTSKNLEEELRHKNVRLVDINRSSNSVNQINQSLNKLSEKIELILCGVPDSKNYRNHLKYAKDLAPTILEESKKLKNEYQKFLLRLPIA